MFLASLRLFTQRCINVLFSFSACTYIQLYNITPSLRKAMFCLSKYSELWNEEKWRAQYDLPNISSICIDSWMQTIMYLDFEMSNSMHVKQILILEFESFSHQAQAGSEVVWWKYFWVCHPCFWWLFKSKVKEGVSLMCEIYFMINKKFRYYVLF